MKLFIWILFWDFKTQTSQKSVISKIIFYTMKRKLFVSHFSNSYTLHRNYLIQLIVSWDVNQILYLVGFIVLSFISLPYRNLSELRIGQRCFRYYMLYSSKYLSQQDFARLKTRKITAMEYQDQVSLSIGSNMRKENSNYCRKV